jgi:hypothetical protein
MKSLSMEALVSAPQDEPSRFVIIRRLGVQYVYYYWKVTRMRSKVDGSVLVLIQIAWRFVSIRQHNFHLFDAPSITVVDVLTHFGQCPAASAELCIWRSSERAPYASNRSVLAGLG